MNLPSRWRSTGPIVATVLLLAVIAPFAVYAVPQVIGADEGYVVLSGSMEPTLSPGDVVIVDGSTTIEQGDIITYATGQEAIPTTHRVVSVMADGFETKGDANQNADHGLLTSNSVVGEVTVIIPLIGHVILWANTPLGLVTLIVFPLTALVLLELRSWSNSPDGGATTTENSRPSVLPPPTMEVSEGEDIATVGQSSAMELDGDTESGHSGEMTINFVDLKLTLVAMLALFGYAGWNVIREIATVSAPHPVTVGVLTSGLLGLGLTSWITISTWQATRGEATTPPTPGPARTDGSGPLEGSDE
jgi:signal peptidase I, archaeal type